MADQPRLAVESIAGLRPYQEDSVIAETLADGRTLVAVADGMGGHAAGEVASGLALETLVEAIGDRQGLSEAFRLANARVHGMAQEPGKRGMGTTLVAILVEGSEYWVGNVGDSRVYLVSEQGIRRLTEDHSFVAEAVKHGQSEAEAMATPWKDALTRSIGTEPEVEADVSGPHPLPDDSAFLVCSDGLYKTLDEDEIRDLFVRSSGAEGAARSLVAAALEGGSDDNISVAIAENGEVRRGGEQGAEDHPSDRDETTRAEQGAAAASIGEDTPPAMALDEGSAVSGLPMAGVAAVLVVVSALVAILVFGS